MNFDKQKQIKDINEMLEEIEYIKREFIDLNNYDELEIKRVNMLVSQVWLWFMTEYITFTEVKK